MEFQGNSSFARNYPDSNFFNSVLHYFCTVPTGPPYCDETFSFIKLRMNFSASHFKYFLNLFFCFSCSHSLLLCNFRIQLFPNTLASVNKGTSSSSDFRFSNQRCCRVESSGGESKWNLLPQMTIFALSEKESDFVKVFTGASRGQSQAERYVLCTSKILFDIVAFWVVAISKP